MELLYRRITSQSHCFQFILVIKSVTRMIRRGHAGTARKGYVSGTLEVPVQLSSHIVFFLAGVGTCPFLYFVHMSLKYLLEISANYIPSCWVMFKQAICQPFQSWQLPAIYHLPFTVYHWPTIINPCLITRFNECDFGFKLTATNFILQRLGHDVAGTMGFRLG